MGRWAGPPFAGTDGRGGHRRSAAKPCGPEPSAEDRARLRVHGQRRDGPLTHLDRDRRLRGSQPHKEVPPLPSVFGGGPPHRVGSPRGCAATPGVQPDRRYSCGRDALNPHVPRWGRAGRPAATGSPSTPDGTRNARKSGRHRLERSRARRGSGVVRRRRSAPVPARPPGREDCVGQPVAPEAGSIAWLCSYRAGFDAPWSIRPEISRPGNSNATRTR